ncbi:MAG: restriction endonuclease subunit S [Nitrospinae bacterium]|nr:restriction endonuclease subunit S [Nitrospinota bacterium]
MFQSIREATGNVQQHLFIDKVINFKIPQLPNIEYIGGIYKKAEIKFIESNNLYSQAETLLLEELGIKDIDLSHEPCYEINSADTISANRIDAEYYQPKYERMIEAIKKHPHKSIGDMFRLTKGIEPGSSAYCEEGKPFIRVSNLNKFEINDDNQQYLPEKTYLELKANYQPLKGEILLTKDATPRIAYHLKEQIDGIISSGVLRLQALSDIKREYICLVINSIVGQSQIERDSGGSVINHWKPNQVQRTLIPILPDKIQEKIENLCLESHSSRRQAKELLEKAKRKVEEMIEKE